MIQIELYNKVVYDDEQEFLSQKGFELNDSNIQLFNIPNIRNKKFQDIIHILSQVKLEDNHKWNILTERVKQVVLEISKEFTSSEIINKEIKQEILASPIHAPPIPPPLPPSMTSPLPFRSKIKHQQTSSLSNFSPPVIKLSENKVSVPHILVIPPPPIITSPKLDLKSKFRNIPNQASNDQSSPNLIMNNIPTPSKQLKGLPWQKQNSNMSNILYYAIIYFCI